MWHQQSCRWGTKRCQIHDSSKLLHQFIAIQLIWGVSTEFQITMPSQLPQIAGRPHSVGGTYRPYGSRCHGPSEVHSVVPWSHASGSVVWDYGEIDRYKDKRHSASDRPFPAWWDNHEKSVVRQAHFRLPFSCSQWSIEIWAFVTPLLEGAPVA